MNSASVLAAVAAVPVVMLALAGDESGRGKVAGAKTAEAIAALAGVVV